MVDVVCMLWRLVVIQPIKTPLLLICRTLTNRNAWLIVTCCSVTYVLVGKSIFECKNNCLHYTCSYFKYNFFRVLLLLIEQLLYELRLLEYVLLPALVKQSGAVHTALGSDARRQARVHSYWGGCRTRCRVVS